MTNDDNDWFEKFWKLKPYGKQEDVLAHFQGVVYEHKITGKEIHDKWLEYLTMCKVMKREAMYIKSPLNFLIDDGFLASYQTASGMTLNFIERWLEDFLN